MAQIFSSDQAPPSVKWRQINTKHVQLIYPAEIDKEARKLLNNIELIIPQIGNSIGKEPNKISIILQSRGVESNGFVQLAPRRSEFFMTPPQSSDYQPWTHSLAIHELRHVAQFDKLTGHFKKPFFEELALAIFGVSLPAWFYEGDAVGIETASTKAGRGRLPEWDLYFRSNTLSAKRYSYSKDFIGSYKDRTPGYYQLGYFMTSRLRSAGGGYVLDSIYTRMAKGPLRPYNLSRSIKHFTGMNTTGLHALTVSQMDSIWRLEAKEINTNYPRLNERKGSVPTDYLMPQKASSQWIVLKKSFSEPPKLITLDSAGKESLLIRIGTQTENNFHYSNGRVTWDEIRYDPRFHKRSYSVVNLYDLSSKKYKQLTSRSRYFSPTLSPDGKIVAVIDFDISGTMSLVELETNSGKVIRRYPNPANYDLRNPAYTSSGKKIIAVAVSDQGSAIIEYDASSMSQKIILPFQSRQIERPICYGSQIFFKSHYSGHDNIYSIKVGEQNPVQHTFSEFGASNPAIAGGLIYFNNYTLSGEDICYTEIDSLVVPQIAFKNIVAEQISAMESRIVLNDTPGVKDLTSTTYRDRDNLFNFHSLSPIFSEDDPGGRNLGLAFRSTNLLNTLNFYGGYQYDLDLQKSEYLAGFSYRRFYPIINVNYVNRAQLQYIRTSGQSGSVVPVSWRENHTEIEIRLPLVTNRLNRIMSSHFSVVGSHTTRYDIVNKPANFNPRLSFPLKYQLSVGRNAMRGYRDMAPRWGQNISVNYNHLPFESGLSGSLISLRSRFYFPGLFSNHSFQASYNYQQRSGAYRFTTDIPNISGYLLSGSASGSLRNTLLMSYQLPLMYPDLEIGSIAYIKRIRGMMFTDFENLGVDKSRKSYGVSLSGDLHLLRFLLPEFELTGKLIFLDDPGRNASVFQLGLNYNL